MANIWKDSILGVVVGDALGCPVQFERRAEVAKDPVTEMRGYGTFNLPAGSWTDDSSLTLALLDSIVKKGTITLYDVSDNFVKWLDDGEFTPYGYSFDIGGGCQSGILAYKHTGKTMQGGSYERNNGNGSLMRIMPACLYCATRVKNDETAVGMVEDVSAITHAHKRAKMACGIYYFLVKSILHDKRTDNLSSCLQAGIDKAFHYYELEDELAYYKRLVDLAKFAATPERDIKSTGYVVDSLEAAIWSLINTNSFEEALLKAVNLGDDSDTVGAITGGLAGLYYGYDSIPKKWLAEIKRLDWIEGLCDKADDIFSNRVIVVPAGAKLEVTSVKEGEDGIVATFKVKNENDA